MKKNKLYVILSIVCVFVGFSLLYTATTKETKEISYLHADYPRYDHAEDIVNAANLAFSGKVVGIRYEELNIANEGENYLTGYQEESPLLPYTIYTIQTDQVYKGQIESNNIEIKRLGGELDGVNYALDECTPIEEGGSYLFLVATYPSGYPSLINATQGAYSLEQEQVNKTASTELNEILNLLQNK
ncbi:hypothetical protein WKT02_13975 [Erysipelotrichaceae bacterium HCN-30851]